MVFFREVKQLLSLEKIQSTNFDIQVAQTTIRMIQLFVNKSKVQNRSLWNYWMIIQES